MAKPNFNKHGISRAHVQRALSMWDDELAYRSRYVDLILTLCEDINSPFSLRMWYACQNDQLYALSMKVEPGSYKDPWLYYMDNLLLSMVKKYPHWDVSIDPKLEAKKKFIDCERLCRETNKRLFSSNTFFGGRDYSSLMFRASRKIAKILGRVPDVSELDLAFGPGAAFSVTRRTSVYDKLTSSLDITSKSKDQAVELLRSSPGWLSLHEISHDDPRVPEFLTEVEGDRLSFVPKTALIERPIAIGPLVNVVLQKGYGSWIRKRLKRSGLHLNRCPEKHKVLAQRSSQDGSLATVDLASASDTISYALVLKLLPIDWVEALDGVRSERYKVEDQWYDYEKWSAMGNGYTFELESLIFYAVSLAVCEEYGLSNSEVSVFGDDIIIPTEAYEPLSGFLAFCGFEVNHEKSFFHGNFRESCGGDFFNGYDVRGFYIKEALTLRKILEFHNYLHRNGFCYLLIKTMRLVKNLLKPLWFLKGPDDGVDDHIIDPTLSSGGRFLVINTTVKPRRLPKRWLARKAVLLYNNMKPEEYTVWTTYKKYEAPTDVKIYSLSSRFEALNY